MKGLLSANLPEKLAAVVIAVLLWQLVLRIEQPVTGKTFLNVPIVYENLPSGFMETHNVYSATVEAHILGPGVDSIDRANIYLSVDLSNAKPGTFKYRIAKSYRGIGSDLIRLTVSPETTRVTIEEIKQADIPIRAEINGFWEDYKPGSITVSPRTVHVNGPKSVVNAAKEAVVAINLRDVEPGAAAEGRVQVLGADGAVLDLRPEPARVSVLVKPVAQPPSKDVLIQPTWNGSPQFGYRIEKYEITPNEIKLRGPAETLSSLASVETAKIDITGINVTKEITVSLMLPPGTAADVNTVHVKIFVKKDEPAPSGG